MYKQYYSRFLEANKGKLHFAAHSHHFWPDVTRNAMTDYWDDAAKYVDDKWVKILGELIPEAQNHIAKTIQFDFPENIVFAPTTHELIYRLISCFDLSKPFNVLTTDSEFHSFSRQISRLEENENVKVKRIKTFPFDNFQSDFISSVKSETYDLIYLSHVFFNSGFAVQNLNEIVESVTDEKTIIIIDAYHGYFALPTSINKIQDRIFYVSGGYKYAQSGESSCFMTIPKNCSLRPEFTGWFAIFSNMTGKQTGKVNYGDDAFRFWGSTFDPTGIYRINAVMRLMNSINLSVEKIHSHIIYHQNYFLEKLNESNHPILNISNIITPLNTEYRAHFLAFKTESAGELHDKLKEVGVLTDFRNDRLRFGFGLYHEKQDIDELLERIRKV